MGNARKGLLYETLGAGPGSVRRLTKQVVWGTPVLAPQECHHRSPFSAFSMAIFDRVRPALAFAAHFLGKKTDLNRSAVSLDEKLQHVSVVWTVSL